MIAPIAIGRDARDIGIRAVVDKTDIHHLPEVLTEVAS